MEEFEACQSSSGRRSFPHLSAHRCSTGVRQRDLNGKLIRDVKLLLDYFDIKMINLNAQDLSGSFGFIEAAWIPDIVDLAEKNKPRISPTTRKVAAMRRVPFLAFVVVTLGFAADWQSTVRDKMRTTTDPKPHEMPSRIRQHSWVHLRTGETSLKDDVKFHVIQRKDTKTINMSD